MLSGRTQLTDSGAGGRADDTRELLQRVLGNGFRVEALLGSGSFGMVFRARDVRLDRDVAIKTLRREYLVSSEFVRRFEQEARALAALRHPNIVEVYDIGVSDDLVYLIMPLVKGETLAAYLRTRPALSLAEAGRLVHGIAAGLGAAHKAGFIHRDIKPENVMLEGDERRPLLMDFGIAKAFRAGTLGETRAGTILGTPLYMSPEQATADPQIDHRSDIYSLGVVAFEVFTGVLPFQGETGQDLIQQHVLVEPPDPRESKPELPGGVAQAILRAMSKKPSDRYQSAEEFSSALDGHAPGAWLGAGAWLGRTGTLIRGALFLGLLAVVGMVGRRALSPASEAPIALNVQAGETSFTLSAAEPIWGDVANLRRVGAANLDSVIVPAVGARPRAVLDAPVLQLTSKSDSATGVISLDPVVFPVGTSVVLAGGLGDSTVRLTLGDSLPVLPVSVDGPIEMIAGGPPELVRFTLQRLQLIPSNVGLDLELHPSQAPKTGLARMVVSRVSFERVEKIREGDQAKDLVASTVKGGTIQVMNGRRAPQQLSPGGDLTLLGFSGMLEGVAMDTAGLALQFQGTVRGLPASLGGMPAQWEKWWTGQRLRTIALGLLWAGAMLWVVWPRRRRVS